VFKVAEGRPHIVDKLSRPRDRFWSSTTTSGKKAIEDSYSIRRQTLIARHPLLHRVDEAARAAVAAIDGASTGPLTVKPLQEYHPGDRRSALPSPDRPGGVSRSQG